MKIIHIESADLGGEAYRLIEETKYINSNTNHQCIVIGTKGSKFAELAPKQIPFIGFDFYGFNYHPFNFIKAYLLLKKLKPDVIHTHHSKDAWIFGAAARLLRIPIVRGRHITIPFKKSFIKNFVYKYLADAFTISCKSIEDLLLEAKIARPEQIFVTPAGVNFDRFNVRNIDRDYLKKELNLPRDSYLIGTACFLRSWKGVDILIKAFGEFIKDDSYGKYYLIIAGDGPQYQRLKELATAYSDRIFFLGHREDIERVIGGMDLFVLASIKSEAMPQVIPQAMALKVPAIGTKMGGIPDVITDRHTGWLVDPNNVGDLVKTLRLVCSLSYSEKIKIVDNAYQFITKELTVEKTVAKYFEAYNKVMR